MGRTMASLPCSILLMALMLISVIGVLTSPVIIVHAYTEDLELGSNGSSGDVIAFMPYVGSTDENVKSYDVYLVTGDRVIIKYVNGKYMITIKPSNPHRMFMVMRSGSDIVVLPSDVDLKKFDVRLFSIKFLSKYKEYGINYLPLIVKIRSTTPLKMFINELRTRVGFKGVGIKSLGIIHSVAIKVPYTELPRVYGELTKSRDVIKVVPDRIIKALDVRSYRVIEPMLYYSVYMIGARSLWSLGYNGSNIKIAILDTGIDPTHPDFYVNGVSKIVATESFVDWDWDGVPDEPPTDGHGHGTHCAGIAAGSGGYLANVKGVAPGALILAGKVLSDLGFGFDSWIIAGIEWAINNSANIISMSLGGPAIVSYDPLADAANKAMEKGVIMVIAAGNEGPSYFTVSSPGVAPSVITVGAVDKYYRIASFSSVGPTPNATLKPDVVAPGVDIASARANGTYMGEPASLYHIYASGTSMATPHVAGFAALVLQYLNSTGLLQDIKNIYNLTTSLIIKDVIVSTASELGYEPLVEGAGLINATNLVRLVNESKFIIIHPARTDIVGYEGNVTTSLVLINPMNEAINVSLNASFISWSGIIDTSLPSNAISITPTTLTIQPKSEAYVTLSINLNKVPTGYHALKIYLKDSSGDVIGKALIGISRPIKLIVDASYNGTPVSIAVSATGYSPNIGEISLSGLDWGWIASGTGQVVLYPLYPDTTYLVSITATLPSDIVKGIYRAGIYYTMVKVSDDKTEYHISIDFSQITPTSVRTYEGLGGIAVAGYSAVLTVANATTGETITSIIDSSLVYAYLPTGEYRLELYYDVNKTSTTAWGYEYSITPNYFNVKGELQPSTIYPDPTKPMLVYFRVFNDIPKGESIVLHPRKPKVFLIHAHSAVSNETLTSLCSSMNVFSDVTLEDVAVCTYPLIPSVTYYIVDSNANVYGSAFDYVNVSSTSQYGILLSANDWTPIQLKDNVYLYAPLKMPKAATVWSYSTISEGLDKYNFTYLFTAGHLFRQTIWGYYSADAYGYLYPYYGEIIINGIKIVDMYSPLPMLAYLEGFTNETAVPDNASVMYVANLTFPGSKLRFHDYAYIRVDSIYPAPNYTAYQIIGAFGYGVGVRDILPISGYDFILNYVPNNSIAYLYMIFNTPRVYPYYNFDVNKSSIKIYLIGPTGNSIELPIVGWDTYWLLPVAIVELNSTEVLLNDEAGAYDLKITGQYYDVTKETNNYINFEIYVKNDIYVGKPPYMPTGGVPIDKPLVAVVGPPGSGADFTSLSEALNAVRPEGLILINGTVIENSTITVDKDVTIVGLNDVGITMRERTVAFSIKAPATIAFLNVSNTTIAFKLVNTTYTYIESVNAEASKFLEVEAPYESYYWNHIVHEASINATPVAYLIGGGIVKGSYVEVHIVFGDYTVSDAEISSLESINTTVSIHDSKIATLYAVGSSITSYDSVIKSWSGIESTYTGYGKVIVRVLFNGKPVSNAKVKISNSLGSDTASTESDGKATLLGIYAKCVNSVCTYDYSATVTASKKGLKASKTVSLQTTPLTVDVSLPVPTLTIEVKDIFGNVVSELSPGTILSIKSTYDLLTFNGKATVKIVLYKDGVSIASTAIYPSQRKGSVILGVMIPYEDGTYTVKVYLILEGLPSISKSWP
ncbi:MAG: hypothetical protein B6U85_02205 [Desulfurococcales archaeon ex4484_42]|nr:MAG: hypothetical protein B6U85_02205 [Desulfurococcales archaeon ex4484_42]